MTALPAKVKSFLSDAVAKVQVAYGSSDGQGIVGKLGCRPTYIPLFAKAGSGLGSFL